MEFLQWKETAMSRPKHGEICVLCFLLGTIVCWALLIFGGVVGGLPALGFAPPSPAVEKVATYLMGLSLLLFAASYALQRFVLRRATRS